MFHIVKVNQAACQGYVRDCQATITAPLAKSIPGATAALPFGFDFISIPESFRGSETIAKARQRLPVERFHANEGLAIVFADCILKS
jgi:hypothetical protein